MSRKMTELKPCPFCGKQPVTAHLGVYAFCKTIDCPVFGQLIPIAKWNQRAADWQPIETAPKDGTVVDLWDSEDEERHVNCAWLDDFEGDYRWFDEFGSEIVGATHWKPTPEGPK